LSKSGLKLVFNANIVIEAILRSIALINNQPLAGGNICIRKLVDFLPIANSVKQLEDSTRDSPVKNRAKTTL
jgi:hypothetical protein